MTKGLVMQHSAQARVSHGINIDISLQNFFSERPLTIISATPPDDPRSRIYELKLEGTSRCDDFGEPGCRSEGRGLS
jgi:hypothetical protein